MENNKSGRYARWAEEYDKYLESGLTADEWCSKNGISINTFNYRISCIKEYLEERDAGSENVIDDIVLESEGRKITVRKDIDPEKLKMILEYFMQEK